MRKEIIREVLERKLEGAGKDFWRELSEEGKKLVENILDDSLPRKERVEAANKLAEEVEKQARARLGDKYWKGAWTTELHNFLEDVRGLKCSTLSSIDYLDRDVKALSQCQEISNELKSWLADPKNLIKLKYLLDKRLRNEWGFLLGIWRGDPIYLATEPCVGA